jgi:hypothetical protein
MLSFQNSGGAEGMEGEKGLPLLSDNRCPRKGKQADHAEE